MPKTRQSLTHEFVVGGTRGFITVGLYDDGSPGEIFINVAKEGSTISGLLDTISIAVSYALQYGVPLDSLVAKFSYMRFEPSGFTGEEFGFAHSIVDYVFRWMGKRFLDPEKLPKAPKVIPEAAKDIEISMAPDPVMALITVQELTTDAPLCSICGSMTKRAGSCHICINCGETTGCS